jgi:5-oxoprolinase (ATP-hydrolysing)
LDGARDAFADLCSMEEGKTYKLEELAYGFLKVANEAMCRPIRNLTQMKGFDITTHRLACFGGAGPQHACAIAKALGMSKVFVHRYGGILSAYGLSMADAVNEEQEPAAGVYEYCDQAKKQNDPSATIREERLAHLSDKAMNKLISQGYAKDQIKVERYVNLRYEGTDNAVMIEDPGHSPEGNHLPYADAFRAHYRREFGFDLEGRDILIDDYRVRAVVAGKNPDACRPVPDLGAPEPMDKQKAYFENGWEEVNVYNIDHLKPGHEIVGPAIVVQSISTIILEIGCTAKVTSDGDLDIDVVTNDVRDDEEVSTNKEVVEDPVQLSIFSHRFMGVAEQMGRTLQRTAISVNMKERLDFSCALFTADGGLVSFKGSVLSHILLELSFV